MPARTTSQNREVIISAYYQFVLNFHLRFLFHNIIRHVTLLKNFWRRPVFNESATPARCNQSNRVFQFLVQLSSIIPASRGKICVLDISSTPESFYFQEKKIATMTKKLRKNLLANFLEFLMGYYQWRSLFNGRIQDFLFNKDLSKDETQTFLMLLKNFYSMNALKILL